jgi:hypothetical protein
VSSRCLALAQSALAAAEAVVCDLAQQTGSVTTLQWQLDRSMGRLEQQVCEWWRGGGLGTRSWVWGFGSGGGGGPLYHVVHSLTHILSHVLTPCSKHAPHVCWLAGSPTFSFLLS